MKALVYHGPGLRSWDTVADPTIIDPSDVIVRIDTSTICGTDLHILKGDVPETKPGTVLGHVPGCRSRMSNAPKHRQEMGLSCPYE